MHSAKPSLVGSIFERKPSSPPAAPVSRPDPAGKTGFPSVQHRSKSAFSRARDDSKKSRPYRSSDVPQVSPTSRPGPNSLENGLRPEDWREQVEEENRVRVAAMTDEEREEERREILERFGPDVGDILKKAKAMRDAKQSQPESSGSKASTVQKPTEPHSPRILSPRSSTSPSALSRSSTRPSSRADRKIRFADVTPNDVHVYESAPPSPRRKPLALPSPTIDDGPTISLGEWNGWKSKANASTPSAPPPDPGKHAETLEDLEEGTPEDIRRRFFPMAPAHDPSLAWMVPETPSVEAPTTLRFDLSGTPIPPGLSSTLPTHLGLHHHADGAHAGYTLDDVFLLSRSTVPAQRASMLGILSGIARWLAKGRNGEASESIPELVVQEKDLRKRIMAAGVEAMTERGSLGARAVDVLWECIVGWGPDLASIEGIELQDHDKSAAASGDAISSLPLDYVLSQMSSAISAAALPPESLAQLLAILHRLAQHSNDIATSIMTTPGLVAGVVQMFLLTPIPPDVDGSLPDPAAVQLLITLVSSSRENALGILGPSDALLRFVTALPPASPFHPHLATALLTDTLRLYTALASYGLYAQIATTAAEHLARVSAYVRSEACQSAPLREAWLHLLEAWMVCARDPHRTTPSHDILWSQVVGWGWGEEVLELCVRLGDTDRVLWAALWRAEAAWLEGARVNGVKGGGDERALAIEGFREGFRAGVEKRVVEDSCDALEKVLGALAADGIAADLATVRSAARHADVLAAALRIWLACLPTQSPVVPASPPFLLPFSRISNICGNIATHSLWDVLFVDAARGYWYLYCRPLSLLLSSYLRLSRRLPGTSEDSWLAQALAIMSRLLPGDEEAGQSMLEEATEIVTSTFLEPLGWHVPNIIWENGGMQAIRPFLAFSLRPSEETHITPLWVSPQSLSLATTQRLPPASTFSSVSGRASPLPLPRDWFFSPLDHLLRSGQSEAFKSLPASWNASEADVVRSTLLFARVGREVLHAHGLTRFLLSREEILFACMKVFMLEHDQQQNDSTDEVFRDRTVSQFMDELVAPFAAGASPASLSLPATADGTAHTLDTVATRFLGTSTPFYQFYTDFVGLYDAISFSHPLFARLLLPPLSMRYPLDYRKYLWGDFAHVLKTIRTPLDAVLTANIGEYLWPLEADAYVLGSYLAALVRGSLEGFLRFVAIHHVACNIWPDLHDGVGERARKLLQAVVEQGNFDVVREVVCYRQVRVGAILIPPACFAEVGDWKAARREFLDSCGEAVRGRAMKLLE
ncbi:hypothetical protein B0H21DRAFT_766415 [Amylocystis lapponica]|nr:hypothetical protein B0H21DRAFT_766415 [Amylocystis lapponica]